MLFRCCHGSGVSVRKGLKTGGCIVHTVVVGRRAFRRNPLATATTCDLSVGGGVWRS